MRTTKLVSSSGTRHSSAIKGLEPRAMFSALFLGGLISLSLLGEYFIGKKTNFEDAATFGAKTTSVFAKVNGDLIHCSDSRDSSACLDGAEKRKAEHSVLWLGNSQVHAVNQLQRGETNAVPTLFDALKQQNLDLLTYSQPNANLQEHYVLFEYLRSRLPLQILILPIVFDDLRELSLRDEIATFARDEATALALSKTSIGRRLVESNVSVVIKDQDTAGITDTIQERVERSLNLWLENNIPLWQARPEIRGQLIYGFLYNLRNTLFGIKPTSKRKMIIGRYRDNLAALEAILETTKLNGIGVVLYVVPFRGGVEHPYVESEYTQFKLDAEELAGQFDAVFANLESLVPEEFWGVKGSTAVDGDTELDFMHFQASGHQLLAKRLEALVTDALVVGRDSTQ